MRFVHVVASGSNLLFYVEVQHPILGIYYHYLSILLLMGMKVVCSFWLSKIMLLWKIFYMSCCIEVWILLLFMMIRCIVVYYCCSVTKSCLTICDPMDCSTPGSSVLHYFREFANIHVHWASDGTQPSRPLSPSSPAFSLSQHQGLFQWVGFLHQVTKVLELQHQHQSFQWIFRVDFL